LFLIAEANALAIGQTHNAILIRYLRPGYLDAPVEVHLDSEGRITRLVFTDVPPGDGNSISELVQSYLTSFCRVKVIEQGRDSRQIKVLFWRLFHFHVALCEGDVAVATNVEAVVFNSEK
jgi:hypothetical protein